jgi:hypothetical protein
LKGTGRRLESSVWVLGGDADCDDVTFGLGLSLKLVGFGFDHIEVDFRIAIMGDTIELADVLDTVKRNTHSDLELSSGKVDASNHFRGRMLDLETRVKLEKMEFILCMAIEIWIIRGSDQKQGL